MSENDNTRYPSPKTLLEATKIAISEDRPIMLDYWVGSLDKTTMIGVNEIEENGKSTREKLLVRNENEYTSPIQRILKVPVERPNGGKVAEYLIITEHSIYIVDSEIPIRQISSPDFNRED